MCIRDRSACHVTPRPSHLPLPRMPIPACAILSHYQALHRLIESERDERERERAREEERERESKKAREEGRERECQ
eukprot:862493-Rhodomonas_salina.1